MIPSHPSILRGSPPSFFCSARSPPAQNARPAPVITTALTASSDSHSRIADCISSINSELSAFSTSGRFRVIFAYPSFFSRVMCLNSITDYPRILSNFVLACRPPHQLTSRKMMDTRARLPTMLEDSSQSSSVGFEMYRRLSATTWHRAYNAQRDNP